MNKVTGLTDTNMGVLAEFSDSSDQPSAISPEASSTQRWAASTGTWMDASASGQNAGQSTGEPNLRRALHQWLPGEFRKGAAFPVLDVAAASTAPAQLFVVNPNAPSNSVMVGQVLNGAPDCVLSAAPQCTEWGSRTQAPVLSEAPASALAVAGPLILYRSQFNTLNYATMSSGSSWNSSTTSVHP